jgi:hypothetical protein
MHTLCIQLYFFALKTKKCIVINISDIDEITPSMAFDIKKLFKTQVFKVI